MQAPTFQAPIYNSRNYKGLVARGFFKSRHFIYNSRNYKGLVAAFGVLR